MAFDPKDVGGQEVLSVEFWKPSAEGDAIIGRVESFRRGKIGEDATLSMTLSPVIVIPENQKRGTGYASLRVGVNSVLGSRLSDKDAGKFVAIVFDGWERTQSGKMRLFKVWELPPDKFRDLVKKHAPGLLAGGGEEGDEDLPF